MGCKVNNSYRLAMLQKLPVNNFERMEDTSQLNKDFIRNHNEESNDGHFCQCLMLPFTMVYHFHLKIKD